MESLGNLCDKKILITGASSGIGRATAILASKCGAKIIACGRDELRLDETLKQCGGMKNHRKIIFDVRDFLEYENIFREAVTDGEKLDGLVHSAGIATPTPLRALSLEHIKEIIEVNFISFLNLSKFYVNRRYSDGGSVVAISALSAHYPAKAMGVYSATKLALESAVKTFALEVGRKDLRFNCVIPGNVKTPMTEGFEVNSFAERQVLGVLSPESVAKTIIFLLSDMSEAITGRSIYTDGGLFG